MALSRMAPLESERNEKAVHTQKTSLWACFTYPLLIIPFWNLQRWWNDWINSVFLLALSDTMYVKPEDSSSPATTGISSLLLFVYGPPKAKGKILHENRNHLWDDP